MNGATSRSVKPSLGALNAEAAASSKRKLSFKDKHALAKLPERMTELRDALARLDKLLADPQLHARDPKAFARATQDYGARQKDLARAEEEWLAASSQYDEATG